MATEVDWTVFVEFHREPTSSLQTSGVCLIITNSADELAIREFLSCLWSLKWMSVLSWSICHCMGLHLHKKNMNDADALVSGAGFANVADYSIADTSLSHFVLTKGNKSLVISFTTALCSVVQSEKWQCCSCVERRRYLSSESSFMEHWCFSDVNESSHIEFYPVEPIKKESILDSVSWVDIWSDW